MRRHTAHGLAILLSVVSLGAAQGPISSESGSPQKVIPKQQAASPAHQAGANQSLPNWDRLVVWHQFPRETDGQRRTL